MKKYIFKPYNDLFPSLFSKEKERIACRLPQGSCIEHVGSTAVPGLGGKGIIDIAIAVDPSVMDSSKIALEELGYEFRPSFSTPDRLYFIIYLPDPEEDRRRYHIHLTYPESKEWAELIGFRDYLRTHPQELQNYADLKQKAVLAADQDGEKYRKLKEPMFQKFKRSLFHTNMASLIPLYQKHLNLPEAQFTFIDHEDAMVASVFKISQAGRPDLILKVCSRKQDFLRECYFLSRFLGKIPVPKIIQLIKPEVGLDGAILMECIQGDLLKPETINEALAAEIGALLASIHLELAEGYGDLTDPSHLTHDPRIFFTMKFEEGMKECTGHLPENLLETCRRHFANEIDLLSSVDGPCVIHRDFRFGNIIVSDGKVGGIIDWSSARGGFAEDDFCSLEFGEWPAECKNSFLEGYASIRKVPDYKRVVPLLRLSRAVAAVGFTVKRGTWDSRNSKLYQLNRRYLESLLQLDKSF